MPSDKKMNRRPPFARCAATWRRHALALSLSFAVAAPALAQDAPPAAEGDGLRWSASAFGTVGWAQSNRAYRYQRFIDDDGTFERDTLLGAQVDVQLTPRWSATLQARLAPSITEEKRWDVVPTWAFVAWRPTDEWLLRAGKLRLPLFLRSENLDVGQTYDDARLPAEVYAISPTNDFTGAHVAHTWSLASGDLTTEAYRGRGRLTKRFWLREGVPGQLPAGAVFNGVDTTVTGLMTSWRAPDLTLRLGVLHAASKAGDVPFVERPVAAALAPGVSYWQTSNDLPGPGVQTLNRIHNTFIQLGGEAGFGGGWRLAAEGVRARQHDTELGIDVMAGYLTLYRRIGAFTPYATLASIHTRDEAEEWSYRLDTTTVPGVVPGAALLDASMRARADFLAVYRQHSVALGSSYAVSRNGKLKAEWLHSTIRQSQMLDVPTGEPLRKRRTVEALSLSYSFVF